ncbi:isoprenylcysteine carboxyl methyltransferase family protein [Aquibacillus albus]|uniref:Methyltransferase n=1 Tax=Aquibacillus albus TaxID=1168171 RepID=A0ABS2MVL4_9BACI|nr:isoprenylcysteine carboxylmethyltransferase family protein [Aquibacillus albus]MBM7569875.1 methyltransferase [Aquibacillus albus]
MSYVLWIVFIYLIAQRLGELLLARKNEQWMEKQGAYEVGEDHYKWFIYTHSSFFIFLLVEGLLLSSKPFSVSPVLFGIFIATQLFRYWCIVSLGRHWNTKVIILPGAALIRKGPYRFLKHPNYFIVAIELLIIPLLFNAYLTAIVFPLIHLVLLKIRIPIEEQALLDVMPRE